MGHPCFLCRCAELLLFSLPCCAARLFYTPSLPFPWVLLYFLRALPLVSYTPEWDGAGETPGYGDRVIFGAGTFVDGSTAELTADGPLRPPYTVYCQGGTHWTHWALVLEEAISSLRSM